MGLAMTQVCYQLKEVKNIQYNQENKRTMFPVLKMLPHKGQIGPGIYFYHMGYYVLLSEIFFFYLFIIIIIIIVLGAIIY